MPKNYIPIIDNDTGETRLISYDELDDEVLGKLWKPVGGFCYQASDFMNLRLTEAPFYIKGWLPKHGKAEIYAPPKTGKSFLCLQIADCIGSGQPILGMEVTQGVVLYLQFELGEEIMQQRLVNTKADYPNVYVGTDFAIKLDTRAGKERLNKAMAAVEPDVLILDPLYKVISGDENDVKDVRLVLDYLDETIEAFNCSILLMHHPGKDIARGGRGSSVIDDWVDSCIEMRKLSRNGEKLHIKLTPKLLRHSELPPEPIEAEMQDFVFQPYEGMSSVKRAVLDYLLGSSLPVSPKNLLDAGIGSQKSVYDALKSLTEGDLAEKIGRGEYVAIGGERENESI